MSTHDYIVDNQNGANFRSDLNNALAAIVSNNSSATAPTTTYAFMWWADTANDILKQRNAADSAWISILTLSTGAPLGTLSSSLLSGALPAISGANLTGLPAGGITEADQWRLSTDRGTSAGAYTITNNWERVDTANFEKLGTGMTEASGVFTFPSTGYWLIDHHLRGNQVTGATRSVFFSIQVSTDSGSSYTAATSGAINIPDAASGTDYMSGDTKHILKVTNASTFRVLFNGNSAAYFVIDGHTGQTETSASFMKLGDI